MTYTTEPISKLPIITKDPNNDLDYTVNFSDFLAETGDTIANAEVVSESTNCTVHDILVSGSRVTASIAGGTKGRFEPIRYRITTSSVPPKIADQTILISIKEE